MTGVPHTNSYVFLGIQPSYRVSPSYELRQFVCFERNYPSSVILLPAMACATSDASSCDERLLHIKRVINKYTACCTLLDNLQSAHYHLLKAKQQAREVFWVDIPMPEKLDENIQAQVTLLHMIADYKAHIVREMEYAQNELLVPVVYPDGIELSSSVDEELHDVRENCFPRSP